MECMRNLFEEGVLLDGRFRSIKMLNHGSFGMVFLANDVHRNKLVAIKCLLKPGSSAAQSYGLAVDELSKESEFHAKLGSHPNVVNMITSFETESHTFLVLEYCPMGDLYEAIRVGQGPLETEHVRDFMLQLVAAVEHMHSKGVYHRDIKPENIFLTKEGKLKLGDFGLATSEQWTEERAVGSDRYMAPEQYDVLGGYEPGKADLWAVGICLLNILFARNPFVTPTESDPLFADYVLDKESLFDIFPTLSYDTYEVLTHCMCLDPRKRSLANIRDAIERVVSWTTDDERFDDFCSEDREVGFAAANRSPLRTPSIETPMSENGGYFDWAQALTTLPQKQLPTIADEDEPVQYSEDMFADKPEDYAKTMGYYDVQPHSFDSGLGASYGSVPLQLRPRSDNIQIKKPTVVEVEVKDDSFSKSWSDIFIEDEEEEEREQAERENELKRRSWSFSDGGYSDDCDGYDAEWVGSGWDDLIV